MPDLKELRERKAKLVKTQTREAEKLEDLIVKTEEDYFRLMKETYFENYYNQIEKITFKTVMVMLSQDDISILYKASKEFSEEGTMNVDLERIIEKVDWGMKNLKEKVGKECKFFLRLSTRSPKDVIYHLDNFKSLCMTRLQAKQDPSSLSAKLEAFYEASTIALSISTSKEGVNLLRMSSRIQGDLETCVEKGETMNLVIRQFVNFPVKNELRAFVFNGTFTALTQYNPLVFFEELNKAKQEIEEKLKGFMKNLMKALEGTLTSFIADIVFDEEGKVWVVEVNPFGELAGSCLFAWGKDRDVLEGREPFQFRVVEKPLSVGLVKCEMDPRVLQIMEIN